MKKILIPVLLLFAIGTGYSQENASWQHELETLSELEDFEGLSFEDSYETLSELAEHPLNINTATREDLERFPFLTALQIEDLLAYLYQYGPMKSLGELAMIESMDYFQQRLLPYFIYPGESAQEQFPKLKELLEKGRQEVVATVQVPFYRRRGDRDGYLGYPYKHWFKYQFQYGKYLKFGLTGSQDAGEPFLAGRNAFGYDYYSPYIQIGHIGRLKQLVLGRYRLGFGMGLVMNTDFSLGKLVAINRLGRSSNAIRVHSSRSEATYQQGIAGTVELAKNLELIAFFSWRHIDATLNKDSNSIATILETGYHRTQNEMDKKHNASEMVVGGHLNYFRNGLHFGATAFGCSLSKALSPNISALYRRYYPSGKQFYNLSLDYGYLSRKLTFQGETATGNCHDMATIHALSFLLTEELTLMALHRFYSYRYYSLFSNSFSEGGRVQDESGLYVGANWSPVRNLNVITYTDFAWFTWPRYLMAQNSHAWDQFFQITWQTGKWDIVGRYRLKIKNKTTQQHPGNDLYTLHRGRIAVGYSDGPIWAKFQIDLSDFRFNQESKGYMTTGGLSYSHKKWRFTGWMAYFHTQDYDSRLYAYEPGLLYQLSFPSFYGKGIRYILMVQVRLSDKLQWVAKAGATDYFDRNHISSSYQEIERSSITELETQIIWKF